jgi:hypothetical protein
MITVRRSGIQLTGRFVSLQKNHTVDIDQIDPERRGVIVVLGVDG